MPCLDIFYMLLAIYFVLVLIMSIYLTQFPCFVYAYYNEYK